MITILNESPGASPEQLHVLVVPTRRHRSRPDALGQAVWPIGGPEIVHEARPTLNGEVVPRIVVEFERSDEAIRWIARVGTLGFAEGRWVGPEACLCANYTCLADQQVTFRATKCD